MTLGDRLIKYDTCFNRPNNFKPKTISFDNVNDYDFTKGFTEFLISEDYVHLYFDFDSIKSEEEYLDVYNWLEEVSKVFGPFSIGGYCNNDEMEDKGFRRFDEGDHYLSMHVVFYETAISTIDLQNITKHTAKKGFSTKGVHHLVDPNVYKLVSKKEGQTTRQLFRHVLSDKIFSINNEKNKLNHGLILNKKEPNTQIVQIRGSERIIKDDEWKELFTIDTCKKVIKEGTSKTTKSNDINIDNLDNLEVNNKLIILTEEEIKELLSNFEPTYENFTSIVSNLINSPYEKDVVQQYIEDWYFEGDHQNQNTIELYCNKYYEKIETNKWFFSIIKHINNEDKKKELKHKYSDIIIDEDAKINIKDIFTLRSLREKNYTIRDGIGIKVNEFISDLKKCVAVINSAPMIFIVKDYDAPKNTTSLSFLTSKEFKELMKSIHVGKYLKDGKKKPVDAFMIYNEGKNKNHLLKDGVKFYNKRENMFSYFVGYDYKELNKVDDNVISKFLNHVKEVIANNNNEVYEYILNWYAYILQNPCKKTETAILITGK